MNPTGLNVDLDSFFELAELIVGMSSYGLLKIINSETFKPELFYKGDFSTKMGIFGAENPPFGVISDKIASTKKALVQMFQLMILNSLSVH